MNWHHSHKVSMTFGERVSDKIADWMGSWLFLIGQTLFVIVWMVANTWHGFSYMWDSYPFILLNLLFSTQAAYAAPVIMMAQNRQSKRDRHQAEADYQTNIEAKEDIEELMARLSRIETEKLDSILRLLVEPEMIRRKTRKVRAR